MKLEFDNLAVYAASVGVWKPIEIEWASPVTDYGEYLAQGAHYTYDYDVEDEGYMAAVRHIIFLVEDDDLETQMRSLRHELKHAEQVEEIGGLAFTSSYWGVLYEIWDSHGSYEEDNPYEVEANYVMETEWQDLLPCVKGPKL